MRNLRTLLSVVVLGTFLLTMCSLAALAQTNLVVNGDFESGFAAGTNIGIGWTGWNGCWANRPPACGQPSYWAQTDRTKYQRVIGGYWASQGLDGGIVQVVNVVAGKTYDFDFNAGTGNVGGGNTSNRLCSVGYDLSGQNTDGLAATINYTSIPDSSPWNTYHTQFTATGSTVAVWVRVRMYWADSEYFGDFDNFSIKEKVLPDLHITEGPTVASVGEDTATITWTTDNAGTSVIDYGLGDVYTDTVSDGALVTSHSITLTGLIPGRTYHFRAKSENSGVYNSALSLDKTFNTSPTPGATLINGDFEATEGASAPTLNPWTRFGMCDGLFGPGTANTNTFGALPLSPSHVAGSAASYGTDKSMGGMFQRVLTTPGTWYRTTSWIWTWQQGGGPSDVSCRVGIDPTGGIDATSANVEWSAWQYTQPWNDPTGPAQWLKIGSVAKAASSASTVFLQVRHMWAIPWNLTYFDDVAFGTESTMGPSDYQNHIGKAKVFLGEGYPVSFDDKVVTASWDAMVAGSTPPTHNYCYIQESDGSSGIKIDFTNVVPAISRESVPVGCKIKVHGSLSTIASEATLIADKLEVVDVGPVVLPKAVVATGRTIANGSLGVQGPLPGGSGLSNVGVRVRIVGTVTGFTGDPFGTASGIAYVDDGSGITLNDSYFMLPDDATKPVNGVKVFFPLTGSMPPAIGSTAAFTGVAGVDYNVNIGPFAIVRVANDLTDIQTY